MRWAKLRFTVAAAAIASGAWMGGTAEPQQTRPGPKAAPKDLPAEIAPARFEALHSMIKPRKGAECLWLEIPWLTSIAEARERSAKEAKPMLIWRAANGHPLGST